MRVVSFVETTFPNIDTEVQILADWFPGERNPTASARFFLKRAKRSAHLAGLEARGIPLGIEIRPFANLATVKDSRAVAVTRRC